SVSDDSTVHIICIRVILCMIVVVVPALIWIHHVVKYRRRSGLSSSIHRCYTLLLPHKRAYMFSVNNSSKITVSLIWLVFLVAYLWAPVAGAKSYLIFVGLSVIMYAVLDY